MTLGRTIGRARRPWRLALLTVSGLALPGLAGLAGCQLIASLHDVEFVEDAGLKETSTPDVANDARDGAAGVDAVADAPSRDAPPEVGVPDASYSTPQLDLIDDMEDKSGQIAHTGGRNGLWFTYNDGSATGHQTPVAMGTFLATQNNPPRAIPMNLGRGESHYAADTYGSGFAIWGAGMGFNFTSARTQYDASAYIGFTFWARIGSTPTSVDAGVTTVRFNVPDANTDPSGGVCTSCNDFLGRDLTLTNDWEEYTVLFTDLAQSGFGSPYEATLDEKKVYGCQFLVTTDPNVGNAGAWFDVWIDDIYFIKKPK